MKQFTAHSGCICLAWVASVTFAVVPVAGQNRNGDKSPLSPADSSKLRRQKVLVTNRTFQQSFEPYIGSSLPVFITSDALLNAYHVLLEESIARLEARLSEVLPLLLKHLWERLPKAAAEVVGNDPLKTAAHRRATLVLAVAMHLLGESTPGLAAELEALVKTEVRRIESAEGTGKPPWLGEPDPGFLALDYTHYVPRGFYLRTERLKRYFRSVAWLQSVPFRVGNEEELLSALMIANALIREQPPIARFGYVPPPFRAFFEAWHGFIGGSDDLDLAALMESTWTYGEFAAGGPENKLPEAAQELAEEAKENRGGLINDQLSEAPSGTRVAQQLQIRLLPSARLPDAVLFQRTTDPRIVPGRTFPTGLEVAAALRCAVATNWLKTRAPAPVMAQVARTTHALNTESLFGRSLYDDYLRCLASLADAPEKQAPPLMRGEAWQRKTCGTMLASWAQMRRSFVLQAKTNVYFMGLTKREPGFVEPDPEFFQRLGEVAGRTLSLLTAAKALESNGEVEVVADLERCRDTCRHFRLHPEAGGELGVVASETALRGLERLTVFGLTGELVKGRPEMPLDARNDPWAPTKAEYLKALAVWHGRLADFAEVVLRDLAAADKPKRTDMLERLAVPDASSLHDRWMEFIQMVSRIESLAHKQLRYAPFSERERRFIKEFGATLAQAMFYDGNSYLSPRDDSMKIVDVFSGPAGHFHAGVGRPRALYILYPWQGKEVLCIGSVLPYHEFNDPNRLDDAAWKDRLDGPLEPRPPVPEWFAPLLGEAGLWK